MADGADRPSQGAGLSVPSRTEDTQRRVSDPGVSAWVSANAGSGKTHVLIQRVTRLLLADVPPMRIVCITYTKAAAAEMSGRLFGMLGTWALLDDVELEGRLAEIVGEAEARRARAEGKLAGARRLFARALETPGGLKIQTIHSFCEMVLRRFPSEAGLLPGFTVMEDAEATAALDGIVARMAEEALAEDPLLLAAFDALGGEFTPGEGEAGFQKTLQSILADFAGKRGRVARAHEEAGGLEAFIRGLYARHDLTGTETAESIERAALGGVDEAFLLDVATVFAAWGANAIKVADNAKAFLQSEPRSFGALTTLALTAAGTPRKTKPMGKDPVGRVRDFEARWAEVTDLAEGAVAAREAVAFCTLNAALHRLGAEVTRRYAAFKASVGQLDFEDLIERTVRLMGDTSNAWVLYKLDQGIEHVLLDEAQDTGALQWEVIERLTEEFFVGEGAFDRPRTLFVVGDEKQSIYSFQGADSDLFGEKLDLIGTRAGERFVDATLTVSFRSSPPVLRFVDAALRGAKGQPLLGNQYEDHASSRPKDHGRVELWPLIERQDGEKGAPWDLPVDAPAPGDPRKQLADDICVEIKSLLSGERLSKKGHRITPGDVLILCQTRGPQFHEVVRALSAHGIPAAGADKVLMKDDVAVRDLVALMRFCTNPGDCLSLAEALKSPFWGMDEDDLFRLAHGRRGRLWGALLRAAAGTDGFAERCRAAKDEIEAAITAGRRHGAFAFLSAILEHGAPTGRQRIARRLGTVSDEAVAELLNEALDWELRHPRTVEGFLAHMEGFSGEVKKEQGSGADAVRVMTVHGAKGLQSPVVFLADAGYLKAPKDVFKRSPLVELGSENDAGTFEAQSGCLACVKAGTGGSTAPGEAAKAYAEVRRLEEYRRLFYVAATRAAERLYVCGTEQQHRKADAPLEEADWHRLASHAFAKLAEEPEACVSEAAAPDGTTRLRYEFGECPAAKDDPGDPEAYTEDLPAWLTIAAAAERAPRSVAPSRGPLEDEAEGGAADPVDDAPHYPPRLPDQPHGPYLRGTALHGLLERLPDVAPAQRKSVGRALLARDAGDVADAEREVWLAEALAVLSDERFARVFGEGSRAEVPVTGRIAGVPFEGQVDRLVVTPDEVMIVDFKSNRPPPTDPAEAGRQNLYQMAAYAQLIGQVYPGRAVSCALLWTYAPRLMPLPPALLAEALAPRGAA